MTVALSGRHNAVSRRFKPLEILRSLGAGWGLVRPVLLVILPVVLSFTTLILLGLAIQVELVNRTIHALKSNHDAPVSTTGSPELLSARVEFLLAHDRVDEVQPYVEALDKTGSDALRASAHFNYANGRLRQGFDEISADHLEKAGPYVVLAREEYRRSLTLDPEKWDAKFNLDVASRLVRDFPAFERTMGDEVKTPKKLWTDVPGKPEGLP
jgi:mxaK protein